MQISLERRLLLWPLLAGAGLAVALLASGALGGQAPWRARLDLQDFVEYWGAGRVNAAGGDPYDPGTLYCQELEASPALGQAIMMWNPPWTLSVALPFGLFPAQLGHLLWLWLQLSTLLLCTAYLWRFYGGSRQPAWLPAALCLGFIPAYFVIYMGQISPLILLGVVGFLHFERQGRDFWAGALVVLATLKPHLVVVLGAAMALWILQERRWRVLLGSLAGLSVLSALPLACNPHVFEQYWFAMSHRPPQVLSPTIGALLRLILGVDHFGLQFVPTAAGLTWLLWHWQRRRRCWNWQEEMPLLLLASFLAAAYGAWPFDLVVLLVPLIQTAVWICERKQPELVVLGVGTYLGFDFLAFWLRNVHYTEYYWYAWMTPFLLCAYLAIQKEQRVHATADGQLTTERI